MPASIPSTGREYLAQRLDGARDLYLLALAVGGRDSGPPPGSFGPMIRESRIHFASVIEEARIAGLDTSDIGAMLGSPSRNLAASLRPELWQRLEELLRARPKAR